jgi:hypothetical protein
MKDAVRFGLGGHFGSKPQRNETKFRVQRNPAEQVELKRQDALTRCIDAPGHAPVGVHAAAGGPEIAVSAVLPIDCIAAPNLGSWMAG